MQSLFYGISLLIAALSGLGFYLGGLWTWTGFLILFVLVSFLELLFKKLEVKASLTKEKWADLWLFISPVYLTALLLSSSALFLKSTDAVEKWGFTLTTASLLGGFGITIAHELVHRPQAWQRALGVWNLMLVHFSHWGIEHVFGHHKHVATPLDSATAKKNQGLYSFWFQDYFGGIKHAWLFEVNRLKNDSFKYFKNRVLNYFILSVVLLLATGFLISWVVVTYWLMVSAIAILLLLSVDYIEHYGLTRELQESGQYEPVKAHHSWDSNSFFTNTILVNLGLHTHHHMKARLTFQELQAHPSSMKMPYGYSVMVTMALIPPLYFKIMNPKLKKSNQEVICAKKNNPN
jgi:alkane 1-monooxygenase